MKKLFYALAFLLCGVASAGAQDLAVGNVYAEELDQVFQEGENSIHYTFQYSITYLESKQLQIEASMIWGDKVPAGAIDSMYMFLVREYGTSRLNCNITTDKGGGFELGEELNISFYVPAEGGARVQTDINYIVGSKNEAAANTLGLTASVDKITQTSAEIAYEVSIPEEYAGANVTVNYSVDGESKEATSSPISLTDLTPGKNYEYTLVATATLPDKEPLNSKEVKVSFATERDLSKEIHNYQITNGFLPLAYLYDEDVSKAREIPISMIGDFRYNGNKTITATFKVSGHENIVGFMAECNIGDVYWSGDLHPDVEGVYTYTSPVGFEGNESPIIFYWMKFAGGVQRFDVDKFSLLESNTPVQYGSPANIVIRTKSTEAAAGVPQAFCAYIVDENGNFLLNLKPDLKIVDDSANSDLDGDFIILNKQGSATLVASYEGLETRETFTVLHSDAAQNIALGKIPTLCEHGINPQNATDGDYSSKVEFDCAETEEHTLFLDLEDNYNIEYLKLTWEGATPFEYTVTLSKGEEAPYETVATFEIDDEVGGGGATIYRTIPVGNIEARYVTITTHKAFERGWNIKLYQLEVFGNSVTYAHVGAFEPQAWHPNYVELEDFVELPEGFTYEDVTAEVSAVDSGNWATVDFLNNTPWLKTMYEEIMETGSVTANDGNGVAISRKCDGFYDGNATVQVVKGSADNYATLQLAVDCSGVYRITISSDEEITFNIDGEGTNGSSVSHDIQIYPTFDHKYSYHHKHISQDGKEYEDDIENDIFNINDYRYKNAEKGLSYPTSTEAIEALKEAVITIPGVFGADVYYWIDATKAAPGEDKNVTTSSSEKEFAKRRAASLPEGYEKYQPIGTYATDLSALANGGTLHLVMAKNGAVTPLETGSNSASQINVTLDDNVETGVESIATEDNGLVDIYTLQGVCVAKAVNFEVVKTSLTPGIYIVGNKKVAVR